MEMSHDKPDLKLRLLVSCGLPPPPRCVSDLGRQLTTALPAAAMGATVTSVFWPGARTAVPVLFV